MIRSEQGRTGLDVVLSFDIEEHDRIEAAAGLHLGPELKSHCRDRLPVATHWLLETLEWFGLRGTFFVVGQIAVSHPELVRVIHQAGHEVASHGWDHRRILQMTPKTFRVDLLRSRDALQQVTGSAVLGYRAPTFSIVRRTAWALDILAEEGFLYDSSIYPVRHDRYGIPEAPRGPFLAQGWSHTILELPPVTLRVGGINLPVGGGGYFRLFPPAMLRWGLEQLERSNQPRIGTLYFHPWEFDLEQRQLPLRCLSRFRTYVGINASRRRFSALLADGYRFTRAIDTARQLLSLMADLPTATIASRAHCTDSGSVLAFKYT